MERPLTNLMRADRQALSLAEYQAAGGYEGLRRALKRTPKEVQQEVIASGLRGRGGAGFPTGQKWSFVPLTEPLRRPRYFIVNADEMEPGTFKDRYLLEGNPHQVIEGAIIGAFAMMADTAYIFLRMEYAEAGRRLTRALAEAYEAKLLGGNILGSGFDLDMSLHTSAGRYICGEETALLNALEGRRPNPRSKPPFPPTCGLFGHPTSVNNVETVCNVPHILAKGADWYKSLSKSPDAGTKLYGVSGKVKRPGLWELPMGTPIRELLFEHAGGLREGLAFRGLIPGGASTDFLVEQHLDTPMDFESIQKAGSRLGTGTMVVLDDQTCPVGMVLSLIRFFARESCGWCTPCRDGLPWTERLLEALEQGRGQPGDLDLLAEHTRLLAPGRTFCAFAPGAMEPLQSALKWFRQDFERHIRERKCPWR